MIAAFPLDEVKALFYKKVQSSQLYKALVPAIQTPECKVSIHCVYLSYVSCCFWCVHIVCEFLCWLNFSFPQNFVDTLRAWPEWQEVLRILQERGVDKDYVMGQLRALYGLFPR